MDERGLQEAFDRLPGPGNDGVALEGILERVGRARRRRLVVRAATALVVIVAVGFGSLQLYEAVHTPAQLVITDDDMTDADGLKSPAAADQELPAEIRALRDDWQAGRIEIDWPPAPDDAPMASLAWMSLDELFGWIEDMALSPEVTAYLRDDADSESLLAAIRSWPEVTAARFVSKDEALARLREDVENPEILWNLPTNPLPNSIEIAVGTQDAARVVGERLQARPEVDEARWGADTSSSRERVLVWLRAHAHPAGENTTTTFTAVTQVPPLSAAVPADRLLEETERMSSPGTAPSEHRFLVDFTGERVRFEGYVDGKLRFLEVTEGGMTTSLDTLTSSLRANPGNFGESQKARDFLAGLPVETVGQTSVDGRPADIYRVEFPNPDGESSADYGRIYIDRATALRVREEWLVGLDVVRVVTRRTVVSTPELEGLLSRDSVRAS
ncbi:MAG: cell division protein FtsX [Thermoleophilia bacterium]